MRERASVLLLMPAAVLVMVVLAAIAVDHGLTFMAQRQLADAATAAANDAVTYLVDEGALRDDGAYRLRADQARAVVEAWVQAHRLPVTLTGVHVETTGAAGVAVTLVGTVDLVFEPALPGGRDAATVRAHAEAYPAGS